jgi:hypothetical protein
LAICIDIAPKSVLGKETVVLELMFANFRSRPGPKIGRHGCFEVLLQHTDFWTQIHHIFVLELSEMLVIPFKNESKGRF